MAATEPVVEVQGLRTHYETLTGKVRAVDGVSFQIRKGEAMGLAGESGCGKTTVAMSLLKILPLGGRIVGGKILYKGMDLVPLHEKDMRKVRWKGISIVFQGAMNALNPVFRVGDQIVEAIKLHEPGISKEEAKKRVESLLETVGIEPSRADNYPYEFSGGMRQRALIAMALSCSPDLLIADEPGTALDVIVQAQVLRLMRDLKEKFNLAMVMITHDLSIIAETCETVAIMYAGKVAEYGDVKQVFSDPLHPYTKGLLGAFPSLKGPRIRLPSIPGQPPDLLNPPQACRFHPRCPYVMDVCKKIDPPMVEIEKGHWVACHLYPG